MRSRPIPNIIQGVSQQTPQSRRDAQCEAQQDAINRPTLGCEARPGCHILSFLASINVPNAFTYEVVRGSNEHYLFVLYQGLLRVFNLFTGALCSVSHNGGINGYFNNNGEDDRDAFRVQSVGDYHFIINRTVTPVMDPASVSPNPNPAAIVFFQSGNYLTNYQVSVQYAGTVYTFQYQTPDNSVQTNFQYIATNQIAATFFRAMTGVTANTGNGTTAIVGWDSQGILGGATGNGYPTTFTPTVFGGNFYGDLNPGSGNVNIGVATLISLGFRITINGNLLLIERYADQNPFTVDATDGFGDTSISVIQDQVQSLSYLPKGGFNGYVVQVMGVGGSNANGAPYYLKYDSLAGNGGAWVESPAKNTKTLPLNSTMPVAIFCSAPNTFDVVQPAWLPRLSGDGTTSSFDPGFIGKPLTDICYFNGRLGFITASTYDLTQAGNPYNWFPKTSQTILDDDPISGQVAASETTAVLQRSAVLDENLTLWSQRSQFRLNSGVQAFTSQNIQDPQSTSYEFNPNCNFAKIGTKLYFSYEASNWAMINVLQFDQGRALGDTDICAHIPAYIPAGVRGIAISNPIKMLFVRTDGYTNGLYLYNWLEEGGTVLQSAWNVWNLPAGQILWHGLYNQLLYVLQQRPEGLFIVTFPLAQSFTDPGGTYLTRLDYRLAQDSPLQSSVYNAASNTTTINLPYTMAAGEQSTIRVVISADDAVYFRGRICTIISTTATSVTVKGNITGSSYFVGHAISSQRTESPFYIRTATGHIPTERLTLKNYWVDYRNTGYTRIVVTNSQTGETATTSLDNQLPGTKTMGDIQTTWTGSLRAIVDAQASDATITLINDSPFPSYWTSVNMEFESVQRATPMLTPYGGPVQ